MTKVRENGATTGPEVSVAIPVGIAGLTVQFDDASAVLRFDTASGQVMLGDGAVAPAGSVAAMSLPAMAELFGKTDDEPAIDGLDLQRLDATAPANVIDCVEFGWA